jgi:hypothetical protein
MMTGVQCTAGLYCVCRYCVLHELRVMFVPWRLHQGNYKGVRSVDDAPSRSSVLSLLLCSSVVKAKIHIVRRNYITFILILSLHTPVLQFVC